MGRVVHLVETGANLRDVYLLWENDRVVQERSGTDSSVVLRTFFTNGTQEGNTKRMVQRDHLGSVVGLVNSAGVVEAQYSYSPQGERTQTFGASSLGNFPVGFTGFYPIGPDWLSRTRLYSPFLGRWTSPDPARFVEGPNLYRYVGNYLDGAVDPGGMATCYYSITNHTLQCYSRNSGFMGPPLSVGPRGVFSGTPPFDNSPGARGIPNYGPIPPGNYKMNPDRRQRNSDRLRLEPSPPIPGWKCKTYIARCGFQLHKGSESLGCITIDDSNSDAVEEFNQILELLGEESSTNRLVVTQ